MEVQNIIFYNPQNNGDVHYSKGFVDYIRKQIPVYSEYHTKCHPSILKDFDILVKPYKLYNYFQDEIIYFDNEKLLLINTWVGSSHAQFILNEVGCSLTANFKKFSDIFTKLGLKILEPVDYIPDINWKKCDTQPIDNFIEKHLLKKIVLICNGPVFSGQSQNIDLNPIIEKLADLNLNVLFILTDAKDRIQKNNVVYTSDFILTDGSDLNEIGYLGTKANIIVGRGSGPFCFCHNKTNLLDPTKTFVAITNYRTDGLWALPEQLPDNKAKQLWTNKFDFDSIYDTINQQINQ